MTSTALRPATTTPRFRVPWWTRGDLNAFFGLAFNILVNVLTLTSLLIFVVHLPADRVLGTVLPALGIALIAGNAYYTFLARRLGRREQRTDVTALPYGPSVPHMFIVVFVIMLPIYLSTNDPVRAWMAGLAWAFIIGVIVLIGAFVGPAIRKITPRAALLGTLAGISLSFISMRPAGQIWEAAWIGLPVLGIILVGFFTDLKLPGGVPIGLAALLVGTADRLDRRLHVRPRRRGLGARTSPSRCPASTSRCWPTGFRGWRRCSPPPSRWASTTSWRR